MDYSSRLDPATYADEEPVGVAAVPASMLPGPLPDDSWSYIPEQLWQRVLSLGGAYGLHFAQVAEPIIDTVLVPSQCQSFAAELTFLLGVIADPAGQETLSVLRQHATKVARNPSFRLIISPP
jgi:hypothetical protein